MDNLFAGNDIYLPTKYQTYFHQYCLTKSDGSKNDPEESPFPRMIDMWFLSFCIAVANNLEPNMEIKGDKYKAIEGVVFGSDQWRVKCIQLTVLSMTDDEDIIFNSSELLKYANGLALAGLPRLIEILNNRGADVAIDYLSDEIVDMIG